MTGGGLLADVAAAERAPDRLHLWWLGQAGFLVAWDGRHLAIDPYLSDALGRKYAGTAKPHDRLAPPVVGAERLGFVDAVLATHHHGDHLDGDTLAPLLAAAPGAPLVVPAAHRALAAERAAVAPDRLVALDAGESADVAGVRVTAVPAAHETLERDERGHLRHLGYVLVCGPFRIYHAGDTVLFDGQAAAVGAVDAALLPINGRGIPGTPGNLDAREAAALAAALPARVAVPCHFGLFAFNTAAPEPFATACARLGVAARVLRPGERLTLATPGSGR